MYHNHRYGAPKEPSRSSSSISSSLRFGGPLPNSAYSPTLTTLAQTYSYQRRQLEATEHQRTLRTPSRSYNDNNNNDTTQGQQRPSTAPGSRATVRSSTLPLTPPRAHQRPSTSSSSSRGFESSRLPYTGTTATKAWEWRGKTFHIGILPPERREIKSPVRATPSYERMRNGDMSLPPRSPSQPTKVQRRQKEDEDVVAQEEIAAAAELIRVARTHANAPPSPPPTPKREDLTTSREEATILARPVKARSVTTPSLTRSTAIAIVAAPPTKETKREEEDEVQPERRAVERAVFH